MRTKPTDEWIESARRYIVQYECDCDCFICARGDHADKDCPHRFPEKRKSI